MLILEFCSFLNFLSLLFGQIDLSPNFGLKGGFNFVRRHYVSIQPEGHLFEDVRGPTPNFLLLKQGKNGVSIIQTPSILCG